MIAFSESAAADLRQRAAGLGLDYPFIYVNDAAAGQDPFPLYGRGRSLRRMRAIQRKYDREGVFQELVESGFRLFAEDD